MQGWDESLLAHLRATQFLWIVVYSGLALSVPMAAATAHFWHAPLHEISATIFYTSAFLNLGAIIWAFVVQYRIRQDAHRQRSPAARFAVAEYGSRRAILPLSAAGFFAVAGGLMTGDWIQLAFLVPIFGFALLFFPTRRRVDRYLHVSQRTSARDV